MTYAALLLTLLAVTGANPPSGPEPILLDFHAEWCGPCRQMRPNIDTLVRAGYPVKSVDIDQHEDLAARYKVTGVPAFIVVGPDGRELARTSGLQPAEDIATLYREARRKLIAAGNVERAEPVAERPTAVAVADEEEPAADSPAALPKPWETVVRIKVHGNGSIGFGSGTVIHSTPQESLILTCAHIFQSEGQRAVSPRNFPRVVEVDLFDGTLRSRGSGPGQVLHNGEKHRAEVIDFDVVHDVGLIRIRPGRRLPASPVVPPQWKPRPRLEMTAVGCSEGRDATAWTTTITNPVVRGLSGRPTYEAIECSHAPLQGRSGGGLYTPEGYLAGVCDFAEPRGNHGLYATPKSIYRLLDKNNLMALYQPEARGPKTLLADSGRPSTRRAAAGTVARAQSPDREDGAEVRIPDPELLGIRPPATETTAASLNSRRDAWQTSTAAPVTSDMRKPPGPGDGPTEADQGVADATAMPDEPAPSGSETITPVPPRRSGPWRAVRSREFPPLRTED